MHGKDLVTFQCLVRSPLSRGAIVGLIQVRANRVPMTGQADASVVELFQFPFYLFQTRPHLQDRTWLERSHRRWHARGLVG